MARRILLVEDDHETHQTILRALGACGDAVDRAPDAATALALASRHRYDAILLDYHHPAMAGHALARALRRLALGLGREARLVGLAAEGALAVRRGADGLFDAVLARPLAEADVAAALAPATPAGGLPMNASADQVMAASLALWQARGLSDRPAALAVPAPDAETAAALSLCFRLVEAGEADCILLLERHGLRMIPAPAADAAPRPVIALGADLADVADCVFDVDDAASWARVAQRLAPQDMRPAPAAPSPTATRGVSPLALHAPAAAGLVDGLRTILREDILIPLAAARMAAAGPAAGDLAAVIARVEAAAGGLAAVLADPAPAGDPAQSVDLAGLIGEVVPRTGREAPAVVAIDSRVAARVRLDGDHLRHLLFTLLDHVAGGSPASGPRITVTCEPYDRLRLTLAAPPGPTCPPAAPAHPAMRRLEGLRLAAVHRLVGLMGGDLEVADGAQGRSVGVSLPYRPDQAGTRPAQAACVMLLHADPLGEAILRSFIAGAGCACVSLELSEGSAAVAAAQDRPAAVLVDVPGEAGQRRHVLAAMSAIRDALWPAPVVALVDRAAWLSDEEARLFDAVREKPRHTRDIDAIVAAVDLWARPAPAADLVDADVLAGIVQSLGSDTVEALLARLRSVVELQLVPLHHDAAADPAERLRLAASVGSAAGMLGLTALRSVCSEGGADLTRVGALADESIRAALRLARAA